MDVLIWVIVYTDRGPREVLQVVIQLDEEDAIVTVNETYLLLQGRGPQRGVIGPVTSPLSSAPWISQLEESDFFALVLDLVD